MQGIRGELIWGVPAIADEIGRDERQVYHLLSTGALPGAKKIGGRWVVARSKLCALFLGDNPADQLR